jgi:hypothetical protein
VNQVDIVTENFDEVSRKMVYSSSSFNWDMLSESYGLQHRDSGNQSQVLFFESQLKEESQTCLASKIGYFRRVSEVFLEETRRSGVIKSQMPGKCNAFNNPDGPSVFHAGGNASLPHYAISES